MSWSLARPLVSSAWCPGCNPCGPWMWPSCPRAKPSRGPGPLQPIQPLPSAPAARGGVRETGDLNNGRKLLCLRVSWSPALFPVRVITRDAVSNVSELRARAGCDNESIVPSVGHCHRLRAPNTRDRRARGTPRKTRAAAGLRAEEGDPACHWRRCLGLRQGPVGGSGAPLVGGRGFHL